MPPPLYSPWGGRRHFLRGGQRRRQLGRILVGLAIIVAVIYLLQRLTGSRNRSSWL
jgi:hypothetical protein